jgi:hypothetical protein
MRIAQRFNAGNYVAPEKVPQGRLNESTEPGWFSRPCGTQRFRIVFPALKRRAIVAMSLL